MRYLWLLCAILIAADCSLEMPEGPRSHFWVISLEQIPNAQVRPRLQQYTYSPGDGIEMQTWLSDHPFRFRFAPDRVIALDEPLGDGYACYEANLLNRDMNVCVPENGYWRGTDYFLVTR